jgi:hypothetical protein
MCTEQPLLLAIEIMQVSLPLALLNLLFTVFGFFGQILSLKLMHC